MPKLPQSFIERHYPLIRALDTIYQDLMEKHYKVAPKNGTIPVGGGDWMDYFFKSEGLRGVIGIWNTKRKDYTVHRWEKTAHDFIEYTVKRAVNASNT